MSTRILEIELTENLSAIQLEKAYNSYRLLVRVRQHPIGWISFWPIAGQEVISVENIYSALASQIPLSIIPHALSNQLWPGRQTDYSQLGISVIICTRDRTENLGRCLESFSNVQFHQFEIIVVDNAPSNDDSLHLASKFPVRYVREDRPGLDWARNRGIAEARFDIVAFTDDDAMVDRHWLQTIANAFSDSEVMAVTGFVAPSELATIAQHVFEDAYGGMGHGFRRKVIKKNQLNKRQLLWASGFGVGANMAFRKSVFEATGKFDIALDVGTPSHGGGDIEMFHRLVMKGYKLVYDPKVMIWHTHRREMKALQKQVFDNGRSLGCYLLTCLHNRSAGFGTVFTFLVIDWLKNWIIRNFIHPPRGFKRSLSIRELFGMITSPLAYRSAQVNGKRIVNSNLK
jgi:glycosyltransferase involved in cell wall biosynthesis